MFSVSNKKYCLYRYQKADDLIATDFAALFMFIKEILKLKHFLQRVTLRYLFRFEIFETTI